MTTRTLLLTLHIVSVAGWLGADILHYVVTPRLDAASTEVALAWARVEDFLHERYFAAVAVAVLASGVGLVFESDWSWSAGFLWVGIGAVVGGAALGGGGLGSLAKKRTAALDGGDTSAAVALRRRMFPIQLVVTLLPVVAVVAMVGKWRA